MKNVFFIIISLFVIAVAAPAMADDVDRVSLGLGYYDINDDEGAADFRLEYRPGTPLFWELRPWIGAEVTSDGGAYGALGFLYDFHLGNNWLLIPNFGAGLYADGGGKELGHAIEFRSQIEVAYQFDNASRLGLAFGHISNAGIGDKNPGTEILNLYYHIPLNWVASGPGSSGY